MKNQYVGDIGDYIKYVLLKTIIEGESKKKLGVAWYLTPDDGGSDGRHTGYLHAPEKWQFLDEKVFDALRELVCCDNVRSVVEVKKKFLERKILPESTVFFDEELPHGKGKSECREKWFTRLQKHLKDCDIIFADPDNALVNPCEGKSFSQKHITLQEAIALVKSPKHIGIFYHHFAHTDNKEQIQNWCKSLSRECPSEKGDAKVMALHWRIISPRAFFIVNPTPPIKEKLIELRGKGAKLLNSKKMESIELYGLDNKRFGVIKNPA